MKEDIIAGLDIGSTGIRLVVGQKVNHLGNEELQIIGAVSSPTFGVSRGSINSIDEATSAVSAALEKAERLVGVPLSSVWVSYNSPKIKCERSKGVVVVSKSNGEIDAQDVERAMEAAKSMVVPNNYEILHVIPMRFTIDNQEDIKDPIGMSGLRLEVETLIILGLSNQVKNLTKAVYRTGLDIDGVIMSSLAMADAVLDSRQKDLGVALINIGATTTSLSVYEEGNLLSTSILPIGADHITNDIAIGLRCPINLAERIKIEHGYSEAAAVGKKEEVDISDLVKEEGINDNIDVISKKYVAEIIEARVEEIFSKVDQELKLIDRSGMLPAGAILVGGGSLLKGIAETAKRQLRLPVGLGEAKNLQLAIEKAKSPEFLTALGLVAWGHHMAPGGKTNWKKNLGGVMSRVKGFMSKVMPQ